MLCSLSFSSIPAINLSLSLSHSHYYNGRLLWDSPKVNRTISAPPHPNWGGSYSKDQINFFFSFSLLAPRVLLAQYTVHPTKSPDAFPTTSRFPFYLAVADISSNYRTLWVDSSDVYGRRTRIDVSRAFYLPSLPW